ncbi:lipoyl amidotransferase LIPT1, mitochondrial [Notothenia coriiceps]|uniref:Lipoyl amidotransferase LIPT1, mitochondrial n=1 Tax=Notothenia coriiceps TaxID=8208 RepID=A0A6I9PBX1_9TELE|nr:PREDICTED: lipoyltransferase 1, mitochondrial [Notothenia coriiceps]
MLAVRRSLSLLGGASRSSSSLFGSSLVGSSSCSPSPISSLIGSSSSSSSPISSLIGSYLFRSFSSSSSSSLIGSSLIGSSLVRSFSSSSSSSPRSSSLIGSSSLVDSSSALLGSSSPGLVLLSLSTDVFQNLALEEWIDAHLDLQKLRLLLLWRNRPSVVIGRHQNPWMEADLPVMRRAGVPLARRRSGGGTVYHDLGNLNATFFSSKQAYDRPRNLKVVTDALKRLCPQLDVRATERLDIVLNGHLKISGSASRLSRKSSYHHLTLLHSADRASLSSMLRPSCDGIHSNATPSVRSPVANLSDHAPSLKWEELMEALQVQFNTEFGLSAAPSHVDPSDDSAFPGVLAAAEDLRGWDWTFGKTPKFSLQTSLPGGGHLSLQVVSGRMEGVELSLLEDWIPERLIGAMTDALCGEKFCRKHAAAALSARLLQGGGVQHRVKVLCDDIINALG